MLRPSPPGCTRPAKYLLGALLALLLRPAGPRAAPQQAPGEPYRVRVELALIQASVRDADGEFRRGLRDSDFRLLEDGVERDIVSFSEEEGPVRVAFLLDVSGSMALQGRLGLAQGAVRAFLERLAPGDVAALYVFSDGALDVAADFTADRSTVAEALAAQEGYGQTALIDAVARAPELVIRQGSAPGAIVLLSDGVDNISRLPLDQALELARRTEVPVYSLGLLDRHETRRRATGARILSRFSQETGGDAFFADDLYEAGRAVRQVAAELKHAYVLGYYPSEGPGPRRVEVQVTCRGCRVTSRQGLYARAAEP